MTLGSLGYQIIGLAQLASPFLDSIREEERSAQQEREKRGTGRGEEKNSLLKKEKKQLEAAGEDGRIREEEALLSCLPDTNAIMILAITSSGPY